MPERPAKSPRLASVAALVAQDRPGRCGPITSIESPMFSKAPMASKGNNTNAQPFWRVQSVPSNHPPLGEGPRPSTCPSCLAPPPSHSNTHASPEGRPQGNAQPCASSVKVRIFARDSTSRTVTCPAAPSMHKVQPSARGRSGSGWFKARTTSTAWSSESRRATHVKPVPPSPRTRLRPPLQAGGGRPSSTEAQPWLETAGTCRFGWTRIEMSWLAIAGTRRRPLNSIRRGEAGKTTRRGRRAHDFGVR